MRAAPLSTQPKRHAGAASKAPRPKAKLGVEVAGGAAEMGFILTAPLAVRARRTRSDF